jgi:putative membrane protein
VDSKHQATIDKFSKMSSGDAFDKAYAKDMVKDHEEDIAEFEKVSKQVKDADLKKFIDDTVPVTKEHLEMAKKMPGAK